MKVGATMISPLSRGHVLYANYAWDLVLSFPRLDSRSGKNRKRNVSITAGRANFSLVQRGRRRPDRFTHSNLEHTRQTVRIAQPVNEHSASSDIPRLSAPLPRSRERSVDVPLLRRRFVVALDDDETWPDEYSDHPSSRGGRATTERKRDACLTHRSLPCFHLPPLPPLAPPFSSCQPSCRLLHAPLLRAQPPAFKDSRSVASMQITNSSYHEFILSRIYFISESYFESRLCRVK